MSVEINKMRFCESLWHFEGTSDVCFDDVVLMDGVPNGFVVDVVGHKVVHRKEGRSGNLNNGFGKMDGEGFSDRGTGKIFDVKFGVHCVLVAGSWNEIQ